MVRAWVLLGGILLGAVSGTSVWASQNEVVTSHDSSASLYRSVGRVALPVDDLKVATSVILSFKEYGDWALLGINGDEGNSQKFIALLKGMDFLEGSEKGSSTSAEGLFDVLYDVDLIWPFGSKNHRVQLRVGGLERDESGQVKRLRLDLSQSNLVLSSFSVLFEVTSDTDRNVWVDFQCETRFAGWIDTFFNVERYKRNIEWRLMKLMGNLVARTALKAGNSKKEVARSEKPMAD